MATEAGSQMYADFGFALSDHPLVRAKLGHN